MTRSLETYILNARLMPAEARKVRALCEDSEYITTVLLAIAMYLYDEQDEDGARIVQHCMLQMAHHEAETA